MTSACDEAGALEGTKSLEGQGSGSGRAQLDMGLGWDSSLGRCRSLGGDLSRRQGPAPGRRQGPGPGGH